MASPGGHGAASMGPVHKRRTPHTKRQRPQDRFSELNRGFNHFSSTCSRDAGATAAMLTAQETFQQITSDIHSSELDSKFLAQMSLVLQALRSAAPKPKPCAQRSEECQTSRGGSSTGGAANPKAVKPKELLPVVRPPSIQPRALGRPRNKLSIQGRPRYRSRRPFTCSACKRQGLSGIGHTRSSRNCPLASAGKTPPRPRSGGSNEQPTGPTGGSNQTSNASTTSRKRSVRERSERSDSSRAVDETRKRARNAGTARRSARLRANQPRRGQDNTNGC